MTTEPIRLLHVEDNTLEAVLIRRVLERSSGQFVLEHVASVAAALARFDRWAERPLDVVLTDLHLPDGTGTAVLARARDLVPPPAVIVLTGGGDEADVVAALKAGAVDYQLKRDDYLQRLPATLAAGLARHRTESASRSSPLTVLYVENNPVDADLTRRHLSRHAPHIRLEVVATPQRCLERLTDPQAAMVEVLMLDYGLGTMTALELVKELRATHSVRLPVVMVTGQGNEEVALQAMRLGISDYLVKNPGYLDRLPWVLDNVRSRAALQESERRRMSALEAGSMMDWRWDIAADRTLWGRDPQLLLGPRPAGGADYPDFREMVHPDDRAHFLAAGRRSIHEGVPYEAEFRLARTDGEVRWLLGQGMPVRDANGRIVALTGIHVDITARKVAEEALARLNAELEQRVAERTRELQEANRELESFSFTVAHDLGAPLRAMRGFVRLLDADFGCAVPEEAKGFLDRIARNAEHMESLVDGLLEFSRTSRKPIERVVRPLRGVVDQALEMLHAEIEGREVEIAIGDLGNASIDPSLFLQVMLNLLANALKFTRHRPLAVIRVGAEHSSGGRAYYVKDNGVGFDPSRAGKLFRVFQRLHRQDEFEGTGIGLATVARIIERHGGRVWAEAVPDEGATFRFTLDEAPAAQVPARG